MAVSAGASCVSAGAEGYETQDSGIGKKTFNFVRGCYESAQDLSNAEKNRYASVLTDYVLSAMAPDYRGDVLNAVASRFVQSYIKGGGDENRSLGRFFGFACDVTIFNAGFAAVKSLNRAFALSGFHGEGFDVVYSKLDAVLKDVHFPMEKKEALIDFVRFEASCFRRDLARYGMASVVHDQVDALMSPSLDAKS
ncbi:MAG: hypothetical protein ACPGRX_06650 [Bdellovibrionales bacterium]